MYDVDEQKASLRRFRNAALLAIAILANSRPELREKLRAFRAEQAEKIAKEVL